MPTRPARAPFRAHLDIGLARADHGDVDGGYRAGSAREQGVDGVESKAVGVDVESEPAEEQDEGADDDVGHVVALEVFALAEALARADDDRACQRKEAADHVNYAGAGVVGEAGADLCQPALIAPCPVAVDGVDDRADDEAVREIGVDLGALGDSSRDDGRGSASEDHLEKPCDEVGILEVQQEEALEADDARGRSAAHHERIAEGPETEGRYAEVEERLGHVVDGVLGADEARAEEGESGLHEEYERGGGDEDEVVELRVDVVSRDATLSVGDSDRAEEDSYAEQGDHRQPELRGG